MALQINPCYPKKGINKKAKLHEGMKMCLLEMKEIQSKIIFMICTPQEEHVC